MLQTYEKCIGNFQRVNVSIGRQKYWDCILRFEQSCGVLVFNQENDGNVCVELQLSDMNPCLQPSLPSKIRGS